MTENGWGKRTRVSEYPRKGRGTMGVKTAQLVEGKGRLAGARIVREGYQVMLISDAGTVIRMAVDGIKRSGRSTQGVIVTRLREGEHVSTLAPVVGSDDDDAELVKTTSDAPVAEAPDDDGSRAGAARRRRRDRPCRGRGRGGVGRGDRRQPERRLRPHAASFSASPRPTFCASFDSAVSRSIGIGKTIVELLLDPISSSVCR